MQTEAENHTYHVSTISKCLMNNLSHKINHTLMHNPVILLFALLIPPVNMQITSMGVLPVQTEHMFTRQLHYLHQPLSCEMSW